MLRQAGGSHGPGKEVPDGGEAPGHHDFQPLVRADLVVRPFAPRQPGAGVCVAGRGGGLRAAAPGEHQQADAHSAEHQHKHHLEGEQPATQAAVDHRVGRVGRVGPGAHRLAPGQGLLQPRAQALLKVANVVGTFRDGHALAFHHPARHLEAVAGRDAVAARLARMHVEPGRQQGGLHRLPGLHARPVVQGGQHAQQQHADADCSEGQGEQGEQPATGLGGSGAARWCAGTCRCCGSEDGALER